MTQNMIEKMTERTEPIALKAQICPKMEPRMSDTIIKSNRETATLRISRSSPWFDDFLPTSSCESKARGSRKRIGT